MLAAWESYYVIVGTSAAALTGLQFVVMALVADTPLSSLRIARELDTSKNHLFSSDVHRQG